MIRPRNETRILLFLMLVLPVLLGPICAGSPDGPDLIVEHEGNAAWVTTSNSFADGNVDFPSEGSRRYWNGLLMQLGEYLEDQEDQDSDPELLVEWEGVKLTKANGEEITYKKGDFNWINIVSEITGQLSPNAPAGSLKPLEPIHAIDLYESGVSDRYRRVHHAMEPKAVITYWQGMKGFKATVEPRGQKDMALHYNRHEFFFNNEFKVSVYKEEIPPLREGTLVGIDTLGVQVAERPGSRLGPKLVEIATFEFGAIKQITVLVKKEGGPGGGAKEDPSWPPGQGGGG